MLENNKIMTTKTKKTSIKIKYYNMLTTTALVKRVLFCP